MKRLDVIAGSAGLLASLAFANSARAQAWPARDITIIVAVCPCSSAYASRAASRCRKPRAWRRACRSRTCSAAPRLPLRRTRGEQAGRLHVRPGQCRRPAGLPAHHEGPLYVGQLQLPRRVAENYYGVGIAAKSPIRTVEDLVAAAKTRRVTYSASAIMNGVAMIQLGNATGVKFQFVPRTPSPRRWRRRSAGTSTSCCRHRPTSFR